MNQALKSMWNMLYSWITERFLLIFYYHQKMLTLHNLENRPLSAFHTQYFNIPLFHHSMAQASR